MYETLENFNKKKNTKSSKKKFQFLQKFKKKKLITKFKLPVLQYLYSELANLNYETFVLLSPKMDNP